MIYMVRRPRKGKRLKIIMTVLNDEGSEHKAGEAVYGTFSYVIIDSMV